MMIKQCSLEYSKSYSSTCCLHVTVQPPFVCNRNNLKFLIAPRKCFLRCWVISSVMFEKSYHWQTGLIILFYFIFFNAFPVNYFRGAPYLAFYYNYVMYSKWHVSRLSDCMPYSLSLPGLRVSLCVSPGFPLRPQERQPTDKTLHLH